ncbi:hypothetical protein FNF28_03476 [Cafeteria roenbergensis]|uniref:Uncharacterized protein n=1 Tax=Cafeteria roenbergensis TaxID=33653 RepID=A0A5A8DN73_CAFRO|nr:hypothetical protein FNF28_03476 [Cafeteria roenbergensis]
MASPSIRERMAMFEKKNSPGAAETPPAAARAPGGSIAERMAKLKASGSPPVPSPKSDAAKTPSSARSPATSSIAERLKALKQASPEGAIPVMGMPRPRQPTSGGPASAPKAPAGVALPGMGSPAPRRALPGMVPAGARAGSGAEEAAAGAGGARPPEAGAAPGQAGTPSHATLNRPSPPRSVVMPSARVRQGPT